MGAEVWRPNLSTFPLPNMRTRKHKLDSSWKHPKTKMNDILVCYILEVLSFLHFMHVHVWGVCMCTQYVRLCIHPCPYLWKPHLLSSFIIFHILFLTHSLLVNLELAYHFGSTGRPVNLGIHLSWHPVPAEPQRTASTPGLTKVLGKPPPVSTFAQQAHHSCLLPGC